MIHPKQFIQAYAKRVASENGVPVSEAMECLDEQAVMMEWMKESIPWMERGPMKAVWWNAVINDQTAHALVTRWMRDHPGTSDSHKHGIDYRLAIMRRDARAAIVSHQ